MLSAIPADRIAAVARHDGGTLRGIVDRAARALAVLEDAASTGGGGEDHLPGARLFPPRL